jgi:molybdate transport system regulatory protein
MHAAAEELGPSYPHLQRRVVELEEAIGQLTRRDRSGKDGGGTQLTPDAVDLIRRFERLRVELSGVTAVSESVVAGTVTEQHGDLATVRTPAGEVTACVPAGTTDVEIAVRADAIVLMDPRSASEGSTSLRNRIPGVVSDLTTEAAVATVTVEVAECVTIESVVTEESVEELDIEVGREVVAAFKTTAARVISVDSS